MNPVGGPNPILVRYFNGEESLEAAATEYVRLISQWLDVSDVELRRLVAEQPTQEPARDVVPLRKLTESDLPKIRALMDLVEAKLDLINKHAREYLSSAGDSPFDGDVRLLADDVRATLGERYVPVVWSTAANIKKFYEGEVPSSRLIEDVQQHFQDTFVDTTWPACPHHPNHPLDFEDGFWRCPRDRSTVARLGELADLRKL